ncbi:hypothetical protein LSTR_LSTR016541 [Laodelphax striatellus]|uniref:Uncharacterized protein n=1 Tax=Laodelphax striatellus TaxID=195883 RepID=A0A482XKF9_LAOST|nr:hypothetical protein LSTR_LSTR016541 [Laodelphax striatellus]
MELKYINNKSFRELVIPAMAIREVLREEYYLRKFKENREKIGRVILDLYEKRKFREYIVTTDKIVYKTTIKDLLGRDSKSAGELVSRAFCLENINKLITDVGKIDYTENSKVWKNNKELFQPLTELFCDNIMLVKILPPDSLDKNNSQLVKKDLCGVNNSLLRGIFHKYNLARHGVKAKRPTTIMEKNKHLNWEKYQAIIPPFYYKRFPTKFVCLPYKIELADEKLSEILRDLPDILLQLEKHDIFMTDIDITQDFTGIFNKREMERYLIENFDFSFPCTDYNRECSNIIVENDKTVGLDCLTWLHKNIRAKVYNKFVCQMTSPGVNKDIGNHIANFVSCPDKRLRETFTNPSAQKHGITRLEVTFYMYKNNNNTGESSLIDLVTSVLEKYKKNICKCTVLFCFYYKAMGKNL